MSIKTTTQQIKNDNIRIEKTIEFNAIFKETNIKSFIEPNYNKLILCSKDTEKPIIRVAGDAINETQLLIEKLTKLKPVFELINNFIDDVSYGYIDLNYNKIKFIYKNTVLIEIKVVNENVLKIESNFEIKKQAIHIPYDEGKLIISTGFNSTEDITYRLEKQITLKELNANILDEMNEKTINIFQKNLNINVKEYPQIEYTIWG